MKRYNPREIEPKWQKIWDQNQTYRADLNSDRPKYYAMSMLNYPSGAGIHIGHAMNYTISDVLARFKRQQGYESYHPVGWDAFGLPAENYAIKTGVSPQQSMAEIIPHYHKQYKAMGWSNDWSKEISTHDPAYYKWTQWIFAQLYRAGLVYQDSRLQWWCSIDNTVLADEQVTADGKCWRHDGPNDPLVEKREIKQWFFKITDYADELLEAIDDLDWSESVKTAQKNWIGKSAGALINFKIEGIDDGLQVFTTRPDTIFGATYLVVAPEHEILNKLSISKEAKDYIEQAKRKSDVARQQESEKQKTGVFTGAYAINPINQAKIPIWIADYVIMTYGTGAIMAVPGHDQRDYDFAQKFDLPIVPVVAPVFGPKLEESKYVEGVVVIGYDPATQKYLSLKNANGAWLIGGGRETYEKFEQSARRELSEEAGYANCKGLIQLGDPVYSYYYNPLKKRNTKSLGYNFLAILNSKEQGQTHQESHEDFKVVWSDFEKLYKDIEKTSRNHDADHWLEALSRAKQAVEAYENQQTYQPGPYEGEGLLINSGKYDGMGSAEAREKIVADLSGVNPLNPAKHEWIKNPETGQEEPVFIQTESDSAVRPDKPVVERQAITALVKHWREDKYIGLKWKTVDWDTLITGGIEDGQTAEEAAIAEIPEETGYQNPILKKDMGTMHAKFFHNPKGENRFAHFSCLYFELADGQREEVSADEQKNHEVVWLTPAEMDNFRLPDSHWYMWNLHQGRQPLARWHTNYRMRDWSVSRQRYWGAPIPIIHCPKCGPQLVPDKDLPVVLPELKDFEPSGDGRSALARAADWLKVKCPNCDGPAERETDTMDTYVDSAWYFLRYLDSRNNTEIFNSKTINKWMPVDFYNGADHATAHMLYARFITRFFAKQGLVENPEPFKKFLFNGKIVDSDGRNFSKSKGNGPDPLDIIADGYGADALRTYLMFAAPLDQYVRWDPKGVPGTFRFLSRLWTLTQEFLEAEAGSGHNEQIAKAINKTTKKVTADIEAQKYNTAIAAMMACVNQLYVIKAKDGFVAKKDWQTGLEDIVQLVAPFAPHIAEELWHDLGHEDSVHINHWPAWDEKLAAEDRITIAVQINGKVRAEVSVYVDSSEAEVLSKAKEAAEEYLVGKTIKKQIYVPGRIVSFVVE